MKKVYQTLIILITFFSFCLSQKKDSIVVYNGSRKIKSVSLTFDACPYKTKGGYDSLIVKYLVENNIPATIFISGQWILKHKDETNYLSKINCLELANHSYSHPNCTKISVDSLKREVEETEKLFLKYTSKRTNLFRPPFGKLNKKMQQTLNSLGYKIIMFDVPSGDPDSTLSKEKIIKHIVSKTKSGSIILMHINCRGWKTAEVLPEIVYQLHQKGYKFVTISELLK